ncbi:MAG TPA: DUF1844 domain-containing protein [Polyangiaceae bacterium]|nr:DUF1844 domain-containing protein [Polyangiaceae bacterium]
MSQGHGEADSSSASEPDDLPAVDFTTFVLSLSHSALLHLGDAPHPNGEKSEVDLPMARQTIDLLALIQEKTHGNLTGAEEQVLTQALYDLRLRFVEISQKHK